MTNDIPGVDGGSNTDVNAKDSAGTMEKGGGDLMVPLAAPVGWRMWNINYKWIYSHDSMTIPGQGWEAVCSNMYGRSRSYHDAPDLDCTCGFYLLENWDDLKEYHRTADGVTTVYSETYYWGRCVWHKTPGRGESWGGKGDNVERKKEGYEGIRAGLVYPKTIYFSEEVHQNSWAIDVAEKYGVKWIIDHEKYYVPSKEELNAKKFSGKVLSQGDKRKIRAQIRKYRAKVAYDIANPGAYSANCKKTHIKELKFWTDLKTW